MITVLRTNKQGTKIVSYTCTDGNKTIDLSKEQLSKYISEKKVINATQQTYKGTLIIRVKNTENLSINRSSSSKDTDNLKNKIHNFKKFLTSIKEIVLLKYTYENNQLCFHISKRATEGIKGAGFSFGKTIEEVQKDNDTCRLEFTIDFSDIEKSNVTKYFYMNGWNIQNRTSSLCEYHTYRYSSVTRTSKVWIEENCNIQKDIAINMDNKLQELFGIPTIQI